MNIIPGNISWGFNASDIFTNSMTLESSVGDFILLAITIYFAPKFYRFVKNVFSGDYKRPSYLDSNKPWLHKDYDGGGLYQGKDGRWYHQ